jgi:phosphoribosylglycinamide formyltransferase-1
MNRAPLALAVLISGTGSNLGALIRAAGEGRLDLDFRVVISNRAEAPGLEFARNAGIPVRVISVKEAGDRSRQETEIARCLHASGAELIVLAGYMQILGENLVGQFEGRMINLHPSLLPLYPGLNTYEQVLATKDRQHGSSIHFVTAELDGGPVISQVRIPVLPGDSPVALAGRLGPNEHRLLLATVELFTRRRVKMYSKSVQLDGQRLQQPLLLNEENTFD